MGHDLAGHCAPREATLVIERLAAGGDGVGRRDGKVVFVPLTAPGDHVEIDSLHERRAFCRARLSRILRPSPDRIEPRCPLFGACGGCSWQQIAYPAQLDAKRAIVVEALRRIGHLSPPPVPPTLPSPRQFGYRHRARLHAVHKGGRTHFGFFAAGSTRLVPVESCPVLHPALNAALGALAAAAGRQPGPFAGCAAVRADTDWSGTSVRLVLRDAGGGAIRLAAAAGDPLRETLAAAGISLLLGEQEAGTLRLGPGAEAPLTSGETFTQVNLEQNEALVRIAVELAAPRPGEAALDLYCGLGNLSLPLAAAGAPVFGVDRDAAAVRQAEENARRLGRDARFACGDAAAAARDLAAAGHRFPLVVANPPRAGARDAAALLAALEPERVVVVSCDPATLARDAATLAAGGYALAAVRPVDLFPQTAHVEVVARFVRRG